MFKKLFLSLLILSALTTEGSLNISEYIITPLLFENLGLNNFTDCEVLPVNERVLPERKGTEGPVLISDANFSKYPTLPEEDNRGGIRPAVTDSYNCCTDLSVSYFRRLEAEGADSFINKDISLHMSDLSPPCKII
ncbi:MAG TPA: hypothetical protein PLA01_01875 [Acetivibrio sp.]|nr:hypothetical protein [Acetivibrio sp.]